MTLYERLRRLMIAAMTAIVFGARTLQSDESERLAALRDLQDRARRRRESDLERDREDARALLEGGGLFGHVVEVEA